MRIEIEIPKEFEERFKQDKFKDSFERIMVDIEHFQHSSKMDIGYALEDMSMKLLKCCRKPLKIADKHIQSTRLLRNWKK